MTKVLQEELQTLMIKIWQALPDHPPSEAERLVAEKLRNEASDDLRNVLGLNVTKRLLNVYNPFFVKLRFSCRPESGCLTKFLDTYNLKSFKRINKKTNTFAARLSSISDFDNICAAKDIRCGGAKITVTPCYKFTLCPKILNTVYAEKGEDIGKTLKNFKAIKEEIMDDKEAAISKEKEIKVKIEPNKAEENNTVVHNDKEPKKIDKIESIKTKVAPKIEITERVITKENKNQKAETIVKAKISEKLPKSEESKDRNQTKKVKSSIVKPVEKVPKKVITTDKAKPKKLSRVKLSILDNEAELDECEGDKEFNDDDEMDDEEILALISSGVIVDEYIGSGEE